MNNVIEFLEELGKSNNLKLEGFDLESLLENEDFDQEVKEAILNKDQSAIEMILDSRSKIVCLIVPAEPDEDERETDDEDDSEDDKSEKSVANAY